MAPQPCPDVIVSVCCNCIPQGRRLARHWMQNGGGSPAAKGSPAGAPVHVLVRQVPCSGKIDAQYLLHAFEAGARGLCVVACPKGDCHLAQGNYRAEVRIRTVQRMLAEVGLERERAELLHFRAEDSVDQLEQLIRQAVQRISACGPTRLAAKGGGGGRDDPADERPLAMRATAPG